jgi:hypothetical protein
VSRTWKTNQLDALDDYKWQNDEYSSIPLLIVFPLCVDARSHEPDACHVKVGKILHAIPHKPPVGSSLFGSPHHPRSE